MAATKTGYAYISACRQDGSEILTAQLRTCAQAQTRILSLMAAIFDFSLPFWLW